MLHRVTRLYTGNMSNWRVAGELSAQTDKVGGLMKESVLTQLKLAKKESGLTFQEIADLSDGLVSKRTLERIFNGKSNLSPERYEFLEEVLGINRQFQGILQGPSDILHLVLHETSKLPREQQMLILQLCREMNKHK